MSKSGWTIISVIILASVISCRDLEKAEVKNNIVGLTNEMPQTIIPLKGDVTKWKADATKASIKFNVDGPFGKVNGSLSGLKSTILFDEKDLPSSFIEASVNPETISTGIKLRDRDLKKEKFLNTKANSFISFRSEKIQKNGNAYKAIGELKLKETKKKIEIPFDFTQKGNSGTFKGSFKINRNDYNVGNKGGSVGDIITINLEVPVTK